MRKLNVTAICFLFCTTTFGVTESAYAKAKINFKTATMITEVEKLGGKMMDGATIQTTLSGKTLKGKDWSWTFNADGTESSKDNKNAWTDKGTWHMKGDQLCRISTATAGATELCSNVYASGHDLRMSDQNASGMLHKWYISY